MVVYVAKCSAVCLGAERNCTVLWLSGHGHHLQHTSNIHHNNHCYSSCYSGETGLSFYSSRNTKVSLCTLRIINITYVLLTESLLQKGGGGLLFFGMKMTGCQAAK